MPYILSLGDQSHSPPSAQMVRWVLRVLAMLEREGTVDAVLCVCWEEEREPDRVGPLGELTRGFQDEEGGPEP